MQANYLFKGIGVALVTLFNEDASLDAPGTADLAAKLVELGVTGVVVAGTTGEASALDLGERTQLLDAVRKVVGARVPVVAGTGAPTQAQAVEFTEAARDAGADAVLTLALPGVADQRPYYEAVAKAAGDVPVLAYHFPKVSSPGVKLEHLADLPVAGMKDSSGDPLRLLATLDSWGQPLYSGAPALITMAGAVGCAGMVLGISNVEPEKCAAAWKGDGAAQLRLAKDIVYSESRFPGTLKELMAKRFGTSTVTRVG